MSAKPANLPEEAVVLYDVYTEYRPRLIDKIQTGYRVIARFKSIELAQELQAIKNAHSVNPVWGVALGGSGLRLREDIVPVPVRRSARAAVLAMLSDQERTAMKLVVPPPNVYQSEIFTLYDLSVQFQGYQTPAGRFFEREEAEKLASTRPGCHPYISEVQCFVSGDVSYAMQGEVLPICASISEALVEEIAPEFRQLLDI